MEKSNFCANWRKSRRPQRSGEKFCVLCGSRRMKLRLREILSSEIFSGGDADGGRKTGNTRTGAAGRSWVGDDALKPGNIYTLTIIGQIEGHQILPETVKTTKYEHVIPLLAAVEESEDIDGLLLLLNTVGGDIEAGLAIAELIAGMKKPTVSLVLGGGHSIGIPLAVSAKKSLIVPTASMTVHPVRMTGLVVGAPQTFQYFQRIQEQIVDFVTANSRIKREKISGIYDGDGRDRDRRRDRGLWPRGGGVRADGPAREPARCARLPAPADRPQQKAAGAEA